MRERTGGMCVWRNETGGASTHLCSCSHLPLSGGIAAEFNFLCTHICVFYNFYSNQIFYNQLNITLLWKENTNLNYPLEATEQH